MKNTIKTVKLLIISGLLSIIPLLTTAQVMGPSDPGAAPQGQPIGGGAPVDGGLFILLGLSALYGGKKVCQINKNKKQV